MLKVIFLLVILYFVFWFFFRKWLRPKVELMKTFQTMSVEDRNKHAGDMFKGVFFALCIIMPVLVLAILALGYTLLYIPDLRFAAAAIITLYFVHSILSKQAKRLMQPKYYEKYSTFQSYVVQIGYLILFIYMAVKL